MLTALVSVVGNNVSSPRLCATFVFALGHIRDAGEKAADETTVSALQQVGGYSQTCLVDLSTTEEKTMEEDACH